MIRLNFYGRFFPNSLQKMLMLSKTSVNALFTENQLIAPFTFHLTPLAPCLKMYKRNKLMCYEKNGNWCILYTC
jgi:hypothetical protein